MDGCRRYVHLVSFLPLRPLPSHASRFKPDALLRGGNVTRAYPGKPFKRPVVKTQQCGSLELFFNLVQASFFVHHLVAVVVPEVALPLFTPCCCCAVAHETAAAPVHTCTHRRSLPAMCPRAGTAKYFRFLDFGYSNRPPTLVYFRFSMYSTPERAVSRYRVCMCPLSLGTAGVRGGKQQTAHSIAMPLLSGVHEKRVCLHVMF